MSNPLKQLGEKEQVIQRFRGEDGHTYRRTQDLTGDVRWGVLNTWHEQARWTVVEDRQERTMTTSELEEAWTNDPPSALDPDRIEPTGVEKVEYFDIEGHDAKFRRVLTVDGNVEFEARTDFKVGGRFQHVDNRHDVEFSEAELKQAWSKV